MPFESNQTESNSRESRENRFDLSTWILIGLGLGIGAGLFFGEYCQSLAILGDAFVGLLRMTVLPYIMVALVANLGRLNPRQSRRLALVGGVVLLAVWSITLFTVFALSHAFPQWKSGSFYSTTATEGTLDVDFVELFIPANVFASLSRYHVPAVVLLCVFAGVTLAGVRNRESLITSLDVLSRVLVRINQGVTRLAPFGIFAIAASTAGTISIDEVGRLQAYILVYTAGALFLGFVALPLFVSTCTPFGYRDVMSISRDAMLTAFATGKLIVVLPLLIEQTEKLFNRIPMEDGDETAPAVDVLYPVAYPFPHAGKLLSMLFIPFAAWFLGSALVWHEYPVLLGAGTLAHFGGPILATPFLLDLMQLPHDMFQLFLLTGVYGERLGDALGALHLAAFTLLATCAFLGSIRIQLRALVRYVTVVTILGVAMVVVLRLSLGVTLKYVEKKEEILANMQLLDKPTASVVIEDARPNPDPLLPGERLLDRIRRRGVIRIGYDGDNLPFAYFNVRDELVGYDIDMAHALARDLGVSIEFVPCDSRTLPAQLKADNFDLVMSGLVGTLERAELMQLTAPYMDVTLALVVPDYRVREFRSLDALRKMEGLRIGFVDLSRGFVSRLQATLPQVELVELTENQHFFEEQHADLDALLISAESGSAFTLLYPEYEVVVPRDLTVQLPLVYAVGAQDTSTRDFLEHWVSLRRDDGTMSDYYDHWILGKTAAPRPPRWCVIRDVLHWVK